MFLPTAFKNPSGFTLIEVLVATAIISIIGIGILSSIGSYLNLSQFSQDKVVARNLANEKIEELRNLPYDELATENGPIFPPGNIQDEEQVTAGGRPFYVLTLISFVDDPFDGDALGTVPMKPQDFYPYDYKRITVRVKDFANERVLAEVTTNASAKAAETASDTGILSLTVLDSVGEPVANADVLLTNPNTTPQVDINTFTDINGRVQIPLLPPDTANGYHIEVGKSGYGSDQTHPDTIPDYDPVNPDFNIIAQQVTEVTLTIDLLSELEITVEDESGALLEDLELTVRGDNPTHRHEFDPDDPGIPEYETTASTNSSGKLTLNNIESDSYSINVPSGYFIVTTSPYQHVSVPANSSISADMVVTTDSTYPRITAINPKTEQTGSIFTIIIDGSNLLSGSTIRLTKSGQPAINATGVTSSGDVQLTGNVDLTGANSGSWNVVVTAPGGSTANQANGFTVSP